jgi:two-component system, cell cycle response regulator
MRVLIADDDNISRLILRKAVEKAGHECLDARDGVEAWELFQASEFELIISDWMMPRMSGIDLCQKVRDEEQGSYTYFIFLSALADKDHLLTGIEAGADDYLTKPLDRAELQVRLISAERITRLHQRLQAQNSELEQLNRQLFEQARRDPLTHLRNRLQLREDLEVLRARVLRYNHRICAVMADIDFFKDYNDRYGHLAGDEVLISVARVLTECSRTGDAAYRYGGEEFLMILPEQSLETAAIAADRIRQAIERLAILHEDNPISGRVTISAGVAELHNNDERKTIDMLLQEADSALYAAKQAGRNRVTCFDG